MTAMDKTDMRLFKTVAQLKTEQLLNSMNLVLQKYYKRDKIYHTQDYILCGEGNIPIMLVAHLDTVFKVSPQSIYYDTEQQVMWSPQGLGADDRAGVFLILKLLQAGYRPSICFTMGEEKGGLGALALIRQFPKAPWPLKYIIELDRQGANDCVFYGCDNQAFTDYVEEFGFLTDYGTFTDISHICPIWKVAGVNLSVGYLNEHSQIETLHIKALYGTLKKVQRMLDDAQNAQTFIYIQDKTSYYAKLWDYYYMNDPATPKYSCSGCGKAYTEDNIIPIKSKTEKGIKKYYCLDCITDDKVGWCAVCGEPFEMVTKRDTKCIDCKDK